MKGLVGELVFVTDVYNEHKISERNSKSGFPAVVSVTSLVYLGIVLSPAPGTSRHSRSYRSHSTTVRSIALISEEIFSYLTIAFPQIRVSQCLHIHSYLI